MNPGGIVQSAMGTLKMGMGLAEMLQGREAMRKLKQNRPAYHTPEAVKESLLLAEQDAGAGMAGYNQAAQNILGNQANAQQRLQGAARSSSDLVNAAAVGQGQSNQAMMQLEAQNAAYKQAARKNVQQQKNTIGGYQDKAWQWNAQDPYLQNYSEASQRASTGQETMYSGMDEIGAGASSAMGGGLLG